MEHEAQACARLRILPWAKLPKQHKRAEAVDRQEVQIGRHHARSNLICPIVSSCTCIGAVGTWALDPGPGPKLQNALVAGDWAFKQLDYWIVSEKKKIRIMDRIMDHIMDLVRLQPHR